MSLLAQAKSLNLKITGLKTFVVNTGSNNWVFCKVSTNAGLVGLGEGSVTSKELTVAAAIQESRSPWRSWSTSIRCSPSPGR